MHKKNFDKATANQVSEDKWVKAHAHHGDEAELRKIHAELQDKKLKENTIKEGKKAAGEGSE